MSQPSTPNRPAKGDHRSRLEAARLAEILDIAADVFIAQGFAGASTNHIARLAKASKTTFYSRFPTKEQLFLAVIEHRMRKVFHEVSGALPLEPPLEVTLHHFGLKLLHNSLSAEQVALIRVVGMEAGRFPELAARFYHLGPGRGHETLSRFLKEHIRHGHLRQDDPAMMSQHFISLVVGGPVLWYVIGLQPSMPGKAKQHTHIQSAVTMFLRAYAAPDGSRR